MVFKFSEKLTSLKGVQKGIFIFYTICGTSPYVISKAGQAPKRNHINTLVFLLQLSLYWTGFVVVADRKGLNDTGVSRVSNFIQLLVNAVAYTVAIVNPLWKFKFYSSIISRFNQIDEQLEDIKARVDQQSTPKIFYGITMAIFAFFFVHTLFDFQVEVVQRDGNPLFWVVYSLPLMVYATSLHQTILFIFAIHKRMELIGRYIQTKNTQNKFPTSVYYTLQVTRCVTPEQESMGKLFKLIKDIYLLSEDVEEFSGPVTLVALGAIFAVASIQSFHVYAIAGYTGEDAGSTFVGLLRSANLLVINLVLVFGLCSTAELVSRDVSAILASAMRDKSNEPASLHGYSSWLNPMLCRIKFSANGFFQLNYNMLFGFISALITYLIILIQFNSISDNKGPTNTHGADFVHNHITEKWVQP